MLPVDSPGPPPAAHLVVMGVSGTGKTTIAEELARRLGREFIEGDDLHPPANVEKMAAGRPLDDADRAPWLATLADVLAERHADGAPCVLTCSALRRAYRDVLRAGAPVFFVHLTASYDVLERRMQGRDHFMPPSLLRSQLDTLEPLQDDEPGAVLDVSRPVEQVVADVLRAVSPRPSP